MTTQTAEPQAAVTGPEAAAREGFVRRNRVWFLVGIALVLALAVSVWASSSDPEYSAALDPQNPDPEGAQAVAQVLGQQGVEVDIARSADELHDAGVDGSTTVVVTGTDQLAPSTTRRLLRDTEGADVVLVDPPVYVVGAVQRGVGAVPAADETTGDCEPYDGLGLEVDQAVGYATADGCFPSNGGFVVAQGRAGLRYFGAGAALSNDQVLRGDNAAVALRMLGQDERLVWYVPTFDDAHDDEAVSLWTFAPDWLVPALWLVLLGVVALALWRGRRLGRLATEPLPVVVRAVETTRSRGRMYRRANDRTYAVTALRAAARRRLADHLQLGRGASEAEVVTAVAHHLGRTEEDVGALLASTAPGPDHDQGLVRLAQQLTDLDREVRRG